MLLPTEAVEAREAEVFADLILETQGLIANYELAELATILDFLQRTREATARGADRMVGQASGAHRTEGAT